MTSKAPAYLPESESETIRRMARERGEAEVALALEIDARTLARAGSGLAMQRATIRRLRNRLADLAKGNDP